MALITHLCLGSKEVLKERASRFAASAGSEEIELVPDEKENDENKNCDDDYSPPITHRMSNESKKRIMSSERPKSQIEMTQSNTSNKTTTSSKYSGPESKALCQQIILCFFLFLITIKTFYSIYEF